VRRHTYLTPKQFTNWLERFDAVADYFEDGDSNWPILGLALGFGAMGGDALKSLFKRAHGIAPGQSWVPADQLDFVIGALILIWPWVHLSWADVATILIISFVGDIAVNHLAHWLGICDTKW